MTFIGRKVCRIKQVVPMTILPRLCFNPPLLQPAKSDTYHCLPCSKDQNLSPYAISALLCNHHAQGDTDAPPEQQSRGVITPSPAGEVEGDDAGGLGGFGAAAAGLAGQVFRVESKLPAFEDAAKQLVHPLFEKLKLQVGGLEGTNYTASAIAAGLHHHTLACKHRYRQTLYIAGIHHVGLLIPH